MSKQEKASLTEQFTEAQQGLLDTLSEMQNSDLQELVRLLPDILTKNNSYGIAVGLKIAGDANITRAEMLAKVLPEITAQDSSAAFAFSEALLARPADEIAFPAVVSPVTTILPSLYAADPQRGKAIFDALKTRGAQQSAPWIFRNLLVHMAPMLQPGESLHAETKGLFSGLKKSIKNMPSDWEVNRYPAIYETLEQLPALMAVDAEKGWNFVEWVDSLKEYKTSFYKSFVKNFPCLAEADPMRAVALMEKIYFAKKVYDGWAQSEVVTGQLVNIAAYDPQAAFRIAEKKKDTGFYDKGLVRRGIPCLAKHDAERALGILDALSQNLQRPDIQWQEFPDALEAFYQSHPDDVVAIAKRLIEDGEEIAMNSLLWTIEKLEDFPQGERLAELVMNKPLPAKPSKVHTTPIGDDHVETAIRTRQMAAGLCGKTYVLPNASMTLAMTELGLG